MSGSDALSFGRERSVSGEEFGISSSPPALDANQGIEELAQPLRRRTLPRNERTERWHHLINPTLNDQFPKFRLGFYVPINRSVAHAKRARHVDNGSLFRAEPSQHFLGGGYNAIASQREFRRGHSDLSAYCFLRSFSQ